MRSEGYSSRSVCLPVCLSVSIYSRTTGYEAAYERYQQLQCYKGRKNNVAILLKRLRSRDMAWKQAKKPICIMSTGLPRPGLARSTHHGRIKFLRGYVSKSSAAVNRPTHDHAASLWEVARTSMRSAFRGPAHQLAVRMRINNCTHGRPWPKQPINQPCTMRQQLRVRRGFAL